MAEIELEVIPEAERRRQGTPLAAPIDGSDRPLPPAAIEALGPPSCAPEASGVDPVADGRTDLIAHRRQADDIVRNRQRGIARLHHREALLWASALASVAIAPATGPVIGAALGVWTWMALVLARRRCWPGHWPILAVIIPAWLAALISLVVDPGGRGHAIIAALAAIAAGTAPMLHRWLVAPLPDPARAAGRSASGDTGRDAPDLAPDDLRRIARIREETAALNHAVHALNWRLNTARSAGAGAAIGLLGLIAAGLGGQLGDIRATGLVAEALAGAAIGAWIRQRQPGVAGGMAAMGIVLPACHFVLLAAGLASFQIFTAIWIWGGWSVSGGFLALAMDLDDEAVPQRTS
jgi:hypothetical protein